ncbi:hypothetical protein HELRODRAFT_179547 [Helobdella robusta]|uniref:VWFA domain-containing protein n=1 Tax=Helobdella robusta TaxID=6412 RepID=T1FEV1_HELRO|nr:hypothetical protein HELRODRAFT_179547 [Helobdella robusta]ESN95217.1 hypothetical protein HELRODRAFT_179547 [Helobdella robusta]
MYYVYKIHVSSVFCLSTGFPQGSVLGPMLFTLFKCQHGHQSTHLNAILKNHLTGLGTLNNLGFTSFNAYSNPALQFVQSVVSNLSSQTSDMRYGFIRFESIAEEMFSLDTYNNNTAATLNAIHKIDYPYDRDTNISGAIWKMHDMFTRKARKGVTKVGIFISDGESKIDGQYVAQYAREAREDKITIIVIAITGLWLQLDELKLIASEHKHKQLLHNITTYSELNSQLEEIVADTCQATEDSTPKSFCEENKDILFLIDGSIISYQDVLKVKLFLKSFSLGVSLKSSRIGVIVYSNVVEYKIPLNIFNSSTTFSDMVDTITVQNNQRADLAEALKTAGKILNLDYRQRIVIIITNRGSSEEKAAIENAVLVIN